MIRSLTTRLPAVFVLLCHSVVLLAACGCMPSGADAAEQAAMRHSSCHEESTGTRVSRADACCCGETPADTTDGVPAASAAAGATPNFPPPAALAPSAGVSGLNQSHASALNRRMGSPPRPPLRV
jgi:hypothetical protein